MVHSVQVVVNVLQALANNTVVVPSTVQDVTGAATHPTVTVNIVQLDTS